jgi:hypothetical protein
LKRDFKILTEIGNLSSKNKSFPSGTEDKIKNGLTSKGLFPISVFATKGSFLNKQTYDYLNSTSSKYLRGPIKSLNSIHNKIIYNNSILKEKTSTSTSHGTGNDVILKYLKTLSIFNKRKNGILIKYNQYIGYNFNKKNNFLRPEPITNILLPSGTNSNNINKSTLLVPGNNKVKTIIKELNRLKGVNGYNSPPVNKTLINNRLIKYSYKLLFYFFKSMYCLISKPVFLITPDKVTIQLFYFLNIPKYKVFKWYSIFNNKLIRQKYYSIRSKQKFKLDNYKSKINTSNRNNLIFNNNSIKEMMNRVKLSIRIKKTLFRLNKKRGIVKSTLFNLFKFNLFKVFSFKFKLICEILSNKFNKPIELQLIRLHQPFHDSNILVNLLSLNLRNKKFKPNVQIEKLYAKKAVKNLYDYSIKSVNYIPAFLSGIKIRIGGRLMREPIIPRITTKIFERGASSPGKVNFLDVATITKKNRKGSYTIKISSGQNLF